MYEYPLIRRSTCTCTKGVPRNQFSSCMLFFLLEYNRSNGDLKLTQKIYTYAWHLRSMSTEGFSSCQFNRRLRERRSSLGYVFLEIFKYVWMLNASALTRESQTIIKRLMTTDVQPLRMLKLILRNSTIIHMYYCQTRR